jgi:hypothetical protein
MTINYSVVNQVDPVTGEKTCVALIDVRTTAEYFWVGTCGKIESITTTSNSHRVDTFYAEFSCFPRERKITHLFRYRQPEFAAASNGGRYINSAAVLFDDFIGNIKAQPVPLCPLVEKNQ